MKNLLFKSLLLTILLTFLLAGTFEQTFAQRKMDRIERQTMKTILGNVKSQIEEKYYDKNFGGIDLNAKYEKAKKRLNEMQTTGQALGVIAQMVMDFDDSHLFFNPPATTMEVEYGWRMKMVGNKCFVTTVKPKSDAEKKGLKPGDQILTVEKFRPTRKDLWKINYFFNILSKRASVNLTILKPGTEKPVKLNIKAKVKKKAKVITKEIFYRLFSNDADPGLSRHFVTKLGEITVWKMPSFAIDPNEINSVISEFKNTNSLIIDLRGNGGGLVKTLERLVGFMFERDLKIADLKGRKEMDPQEAKTEGDKVFKGRLIVLVDSNSGSAAEIFARLIQLEKRGIVMGDVSAGAVMQSRRYPFSVRDSIFYGLSITNADVIMSDGKSLEHVGVMPNARILPSQMDVAKSRDPVLSEAVKLLGGKVSPEQTGSWYKWKWKKDGRVVLELNKK